jgi:hypothetical protein
MLVILIELSSWKKGEPEGNFRTASGDQISRHNLDKSGVPFLNMIVSLFSCEDRQQRTNYRARPILAARTLGSLVRIPFREFCSYLRDFLRYVVTCRWNG